MRFGVVNNAQHDQERDKVNEKRNDLTEELGNRGLTFLFEVDVPEVTIEERHDESSGEEDGGGIDMFAPLDVHAVEKNRGVKCQCETEKLERNSEAHAGAPLQEPADRQDREKRRDENDRGDGGLLSFEQGKHRRC